MTVRLLGKYRWESLPRTGITGWERRRQCAQTSKGHVPKSACVASGQQLVPPLCHVTTVLRIVLKVEEITGAKVLHHLETHPINHPVSELSLRVFGLSLSRPLKQARSHLARWPLLPAPRSARRPVCLCARLCSTCCHPALVRSLGVPSVLQANIPTLRPWAGPALASKLFNLPSEPQPIPKRPACRARAAQRTWWSLCLCSNPSAWNCPPLVFFPDLTESPPSASLPSWHGVAAVLRGRSGFPPGLRALGWRAPTRLPREVT